MIALIGFMGAGKTTVGKLVAARVGVGFVDTDDVVARRAGKPVAAIFAEDGEAAFRKLERDAVIEALAGPEAVVAVGGGAPAEPATKGALEGSTVVHLDVGFDEAMRRVGNGSSRPMLGWREPAELYVERAAAYDAAADMRVLTDGLSPETVAAEVAALMPAPPAPPAPEARRIPVTTKAGSYDVVVGRGLARRAGRLLPPLEGATKAFVVTHPELAAAAKGPLDSLSEEGLEVDIAFVPQGESSKSLEVAGALYNWLASSGAHRDDVVVGVGGGVVTDIAGFVAATYMRGLTWASVPTTLLGQVDAAIGGKTGVNLPQGKNLVGSFWQPAVVICDVDLLAGLPRPEIRSGLAEVVKYGFIADPRLLDVVESRATALLEGDARALTEVVERSVAIKARIVSADEREAGARAHLNYGHTFAHAIERDAVYEGVRHGEAVSLGMMAAARLAFELGRIDAAVVERHRSVLSAAGLPVAAPLDIEALEPAWELDKKYRDGVRFVLLRAIGDPEAGVSAPRELVAKALEGMS